MSIRFATGAALLLAAILAAGATKDGSAMEGNVRTPAVAGQFYSASAQALRREVTGYLDKADPKPVAGEVTAIVAPHAGYMYSGQVAAYGYKLVRGKTYDAVVVISPCHVDRFSYSSIFPGSAYATPLGEVPVDAELAKLIASKSDLVKIDPRGHEVSFMGRAEHSLEVQLPFLQVALGSFKLVPIVMGDQSSRIVEALGKALGSALAGHNVLIVASTDLSHFHEDREARALDGRYQEMLERFDPSALLAGLASEKAEACGGGPTAAAMIAARALGATSCEVLHYANSGDVTNDRDNVVGYVSAVMLRPAAKPAGKEPGGVRGALKGLGDAAAACPDKPVADAKSAAKGKDDSGLGRAEKIYLLRLARAVIERETGGPNALPKPPDSRILREKRGAFVTLHKHGQLRGCIGYIEAIKPLDETIEEMAQAAAFNDWRFTAVVAAEVPQLEIEISVLTPISIVTDPGSIVVGRDGLIVTRGSHRGLLLPQVPVEWKWDRETFLEQTCVKAGLPENAWKEKGTKIERFSAEVFSEKELGIR